MEAIGPGRATPTARPSQGGTGGQRQAGSVLRGLALVAALLVAAAACASLARGALAPAGTDASLTTRPGEAQP